MCQADTRCQKVIPLAVVWPSQDANGSHLVITSGVLAENGHKSFGPQQW